MSPERATPRHSRYDVVIAGARVAGASTALLLARAGARVLVVDPLPLGRDTLSTHALMRGAVVQLHRWGLLERTRAEGTPAVPLTTFDYGDEAITVPIRPGDGIDALYAPRRTVLDPLLSHEAEAAGAEVLRGLSMVDVVRGAEGRITGAVLARADGTRHSVAADLVVGADGLRSRVAGLVGARTLRTARHRTASIFGYWGGLPAEEFRWYFRPGVGIGTIPTNNEETCVFVSVPPGEFEAAREAREGARAGMEGLFHDTVRRVDPALEAHLAAEAPGGTLRAFAGVPGFLREAVGPGWALVGDAGYFRDPLTAHGITDALRDAESLTRGVVGGDAASLARYPEERDAAAVPLMDVTDRIAALDWNVEEVKALHLELSDAMKAGLGVVRGFAARAAA